MTGEPNRCDRVLIGLVTSGQNCVRVAASETCTEHAEGISLMVETT